MHFFKGFGGTFMILSENLKKETINFFDCKGTALEFYVKNHRLEIQKFPQK